MSNSCFSYYGFVFFAFMGILSATYSGTTANHMDNLSHLGKLLLILFACTIAGMIISTLVVRYAAKKNIDKNGSLLIMMVSVYFLIIFTGNITVDSQSEVVNTYTYIGYALNATAIIVLSIITMSIVTNAFDACVQKSPIVNDTSDQQNDGQ